MLWTSLSQTIILGNNYSQLLFPTASTNLFRFKGYFSAEQVSTPKALRIHELKYKNNQCKKNKIIQ